MARSYPVEFRRKVLDLVEVRALPWLPRLLQASPHSAACRIGPNLGVRGVVRGRALIRPSAGRRPRMTVRSARARRWGWEARRASHKARHAVQRPRNEPPRPPRRLAGREDPGDLERQPGLEPGSSASVQAL